MLQRRNPVTHPLGILGDRDSIQHQLRAYPTLPRQTRKVKCQPVTKIDPRVEIIPRIQFERLANSRLEVEVMAQNTPAELARDEDSVTHLRAVPSKRTMRRRLSDRSSES